MDHYEKLQRKTVIDLAEKLFIHRKDMTVGMAIFAAEKFKEETNNYINKRGDYKEKQIGNKIFRYYVEC